MGAEGKGEGQREGQTDTGHMHTTNRAMGRKLIVVSLCSWLGSAEEGTPPPPAHNRTLPVPVSLSDTEDQNMRCDYKEAFFLSDYH